MSGTWKKVSSCTSAWKTEGRKKGRGWGLKISICLVKKPVKTWVSGKERLAQWMFLPQNPNMDWSHSIEEKRKYRFIGNSSKILGVKIMRLCAVVFSNGEKCKTKFQTGVFLSERGLVVFCLRLLTNLRIYCSKSREIRTTNFVRNADGTKSMENFGFILLKWDYCNLT